MRHYVQSADYLKIDPTAFQIYEDNAGKYRWRLRHRNGNIMADSGEGYSERNSAEEALHGVKRNAPNADVEDVSE